VEPDLIYEKLRDVLGRPTGWYDLHASLQRRS